MLSPIAPHISEELWRKLGHTDTVTYEEWPVFDEALLVDNEVEIVIQVNGKLKDKVKISKDLTKDEMEAVALDNVKIKEAIEGKTIRKVIAVPQKLVNIVAN